MAHHSICWAAMSSSCTTLSNIWCENGYKSFILVTLDSAINSMEDSSFQRQTYLSEYWANGRLSYEKTDSSQWSGCFYNGSPSRIIQSTKSSMELTFGKPEAFCDPQKYFLIIKNMISKKQMLLAPTKCIIDLKVQSQSNYKETMSGKPSLGICEWVGTKLPPLVWDLGVRLYALSLESCWCVRRIKKRHSQEQRCMEANCINMAGCLGGTSDCGHLN